MPQDAQPPRRGKWSVALTAFVVGIAATVGVSLAMKGTDQSMFCASCHVMSEAAWTHKNSVHADLACNECHLPSPLAPRLPYKAQVGLNDFYVNTFRDVADVIHATPDMKNVIQENCRRCHYSTTMTVAMNVKTYCTDCHRSVPHQSKLPIDRRMAGDV